MGAVTGVRAASASDSEVVLHNDTQQSLYLRDSSKSSAFFSLLLITLDLLFSFFSFFHSVTLFFSSSREKPALLIYIYSKTVTS